MQTAFGRAAPFSTSARAPAPPSHQMWNARAQASNKSTVVREG